MDDGMSVLVRSLGATSTEEPKSERSNRRAAICLSVIVILLFVGLVAWSSWLLFWSWNNGSWDEYFSQMLPIVGGFFMMWLVPSGSRAIADGRLNAVIRAGAKSLRELAASGDDQLAPLAVPQPEPLVVANLSAPTPIGTEEHPILAGIIYSFVVLLGLMGIGSIIVAGFLASIIANPPNHQQHAWWEYVIGFGMIALLCVMGLAFLWLAVYGASRTRHEQREYHFLADESGLHRGEGRSQRTIAWQEVRSFFRVGPHPAGTRNMDVEFMMLAWSQLHHQGIPPAAAAELRATASRLASRASSGIYVLDAGEQIFTWRVSARPKPANAAAYALLAQVVVASRHLPLRDLTAEAQAVLRVAYDTTAEAGASAPPVPNAMTASPVLAGVPTAPRPRAARRKRWRRIVMLAPLVATVFFYGSGWGLQHYQQALYSGLSARIYAQTPIFADSLTADDGLWPVHAATQDNGAFGFVSGAYQISDGGYEALLNQYYGNVAIAVTVRERPINDYTETMGSLGQVGLVVRETDNPEGLITFTIGPLGDWALMRYRDWGSDSGQWQVLAIGTRNSAIHWGFGNNRLLIVMRGSQYICFVNDKLVGVVNDSALTSGRVGLWVDASTVIGRYTDFAVYPAL